MIFLHDSAVGWKMYKSINIHFHFGEWNSLVGMTTEKFTEDFTLLLLSLSLRHFRLY